MSQSTLAEQLNADRTGYDPTTETYHEQFDWDELKPLTTAISSAVATVTDDDPTAIDPLYEAVDPGTLERLLRSLGDSGREPGGVVEFAFNGRTVAVRPDGEICVHCEPDDFPSR